MDDEIEVWPPADSPEPEPLQGRDAVYQYLLPNLFERQTNEPLEFIEEGDRVLVELRNWARARGSGAEIDQIVFQVWRFSGDLAVRGEVHLDRDAALAALRASDDAAGA